MITEAKVIENAGDELDLADLMDRIRARAEERRVNSLIDTAAILARLPKESDLGETRVANDTRADRLQLQPDLETSDNYRVEDFVRFNDRAFVRNAYRAILKREPDDEGFRRYLEALRSGRLSKIDILASLRFSPEGQNRNVTVYGLSGPARLRKLYRVPVLGYALQLAAGVFRLPSLIADQRRLEAHVAEQDERLLEHIADTGSGLAQKLEDAVEPFSARVAALREAQRQIAELNQQQLRALFREQRELTEDQNRLKQDISNSRSAVEQQFKAHALTDEIQLEKLQELQEFVATEITQKLLRTRAELVLQERRLMTLAERPVAGSPAEAARVIEANGARNDLMDLLYTSLEDQFRGTRADIKEALQIYLPILQAAGVNRDVLDVGCGRGEWLEVLRDEGIAARGIDLNRLALQQCAEAKLDAVDADVLTYLQSVPDNSLSCVTAFHLVEHLPLETLVRVVDESLRTLRSGGLLIIETPNPENLIVGGCNFYFDPTHRHPLPKLTMQCILEARGFSRLQTIELRPMLAERLKGTDELTKRFNQYFYGPMDYAIVAHKI